MIKKASSTTVRKAQPKAASKQSGAAKKRSISQGAKTKSTSGAKKSFYSKHYNSIKELEKDIKNAFGEFIKNFEI